MKHRIGIERSLGNVVSASIGWLEASNISELRDLLLQQGVRRVQRYTRSAASFDGAFRGRAIEVASLTNEDFSWLTADQPIELRHLFRV
jgi:hypothetical protein